MIGKRIKQIRQQKQISQHELAIKTRIFKQSQISKMENNTRLVKVNEVKVIATALNVPISSLWDENPNKEVI